VITRIDLVATSIYIAAMPRGREGEKSADTPSKYQSEERERERKRE
jgi:hypothetical protein